MPACAEVEEQSPDRASATIAASTAGGGSSPSPASSEAIHQVARNTVNERGSGTSAPRDRVIEGSGIELCAPADQFAAADRRQHAEKGARRLPRPQSDGAESLPDSGRDRLQRGGVGGSGQWRIVSHSASEVERISLALRVIAMKRAISSGLAPPILRRTRSRSSRCGLGAEFRQQILDAGDAAKALCFQAGAEIPVVQRRIHFAAERFRSAAAVRRKRFVASDFRSMPSCFNQPAATSQLLSIGPPATASLRPLRSASGLSEMCPAPSRRRARSNKDRMSAWRRGALARYPQPVGHHNVGIAGAQRDLACLGARQFENLNCKIGLLVEAVRADHGEFPGERSGLLHRNAHSLGAAASSGQRDAQELTAASSMRTRSFMATT